MSWKVRLIPIVLFAVYGLYYYVSNQETVPLTGRSQLVDITREQEMSLGLQSYQEILSQSQVIRQGEAVDMTRTIGQKLANATNDVDPGFNWEFNVIQSEQANAFALPGGKTAVYTGLFPVAENANGLAVVMGHEIAHAIARHGAERMAYQKLVQIGSMAASVALGDMDYQTQRAVMGALGVGTQYGVLLPFSRDHESEADYMGLLFMARACFDPTEAPKLWERMGQMSQGNQPAEFMSTHPSHETRIKQFEEWMPEALAIREQHCPNQSTLSS
ncbi:MAG: M48 family metallopeptidase [Nitrospirota bacterium]|nr:MAG: M48 family metallopeptidase [Nitrospirota bacterium]